MAPRIRLAGPHARRYEVRRRRDGPGDGPCCPRSARAARPVAPRDGFGPDHPTVDGARRPRPADRAVRRAWAAAPSKPGPVPRRPRTETPAPRRRRPLPHWNRRVRPSPWPPRRLPDASPLDPAGPRDLRAGRPSMRPVRSPTPRAVARACAQASTASMSEPPTTPETTSPCAPQQGSL